MAQSSNADTEHKILLLTKKWVEVGLVHRELSRAASDNPDSLMLRKSNQECADVTEALWCACEDYWGKP